ncbi:MAG: T9SS type A sorting domain-containing protein [Ignavibacteriales bacterium]|nr:T9SS type A sorting domain-containing protein [Ignavibacteriales bacterium]
MFAKEAGLLPIPITGVSLIGTETLYQGATGVWGAAAQNGLEPFTYNWQIKYVDGGGYLQSFASVKAEKEKKDKDKKKDGGIIINLAPSNEWVPLGLNSDVLTRPHNPTDLRDYYLKCSVTDASGTTKTSNEWFVDVTNDLPPVNPPLSNTLTADNLKSEMNALAKEMEITETPKLFSLEQNYPNPFNPTTRISYSIKEAGLVTLKVFDILGREVSTLVNEVKPAGRFEVEFNASDLPSGTYIYRLTAGNYQTINKMSFVK